MKLMLEMMDVSLSRIFNSNLFILYLVVLLPIGFDENTVPSKDTSSSSLLSSTLNVLVVTWRFLHIVVIGFVIFIIT